MSEILDIARGSRIVSYEEKNTWVFGVIAVVAYGIYVAVVLGTAGETPIPQTPYVVPMIATIGAAIVAGILGGIVLGIAQRRGGVHSDQRDKDIAHLGDRVGNSFVMLGGLGALVLAWTSAHPFWIANAIYLGFIVAAIASTITKAIAYRKGF